MECINKEIDSLSKKYDDILILIDSNNYDNFLENTGINTTCIDLIMTNKPKSFHNSITFVTGLSHFHKMALTIIKSSFKKQNSEC